MSPLILLSLKFKDHRIIAAFRKNKNLQEFLVKAKVKPLVTPKPRGYGEFYKQKTWIRSKDNNNVFKTMAWGSPHTKNCVYLITCSRCGAQYVGQTGNSLLQRFTQHCYNVLRQKETQTPLVSHFLLHGWPSVQVIQATVIQNNPRWTTTQSVQAERLWILKLDTVYPRGLNQK